MTKSHSWCLHKVGCVGTQKDPCKWVIPESIVFCCLLAERKTQRGKLSVLLLIIVHSEVSNTKSLTRADHLI